MSAGELLSPALLTLAVKPAAPANPGPAPAPVAKLPFAVRFGPAGNSPAGQPAPSGVPIVGKVTVTSSAVLDAGL